MIPGRRAPRVASWLEERYDVRELLKTAGKKMVPHDRRSVWSFLGGILLFLLGVQAASGMMLMFYYRPTAMGAHESLTRIMTELPFGWLVRGVHSWGANLMIAALLLHFFSTMLLKAYRKPRELTWVTGMLLLVLTLALGFSGYLLPWDELALTATRVGTDVPRALGAAGTFASAFLRGGEDVTGETLGRFHALHVSLLPLLLLLVAGAHVLLVQLQGMSRPPGKAPHEGEELPFFPNYLYRDLALWTLLFGAVVTLAVLFPPELGPKADPLAPTPEGLKPEWYFLFLFQTIKLFPSRMLFLTGEAAAVSLVLAAACFFVLLPFLDRRSSREEKSPRFTAAAVATLLYFLLLTAWGFLS